MNITQEMIDQAKQNGACSEAIEWLEASPRTWNELVGYNPVWAVWAMIRIPNFPINLEGLSSPRRALVMINRTDCPIDLEGLDSFDRALVMVNRPYLTLNDWNLKTAQLSD